MQIHEITKQSLREGFFGDLKNVGRALTPSKAMASGFAQGVTGVDFSTPGSVNAATAKQAQAAQPAPTAGTQSTADKKNPAQGTIFLVNVGGMEYFKNYQGRWFEKPDSANRFSVSRALQIKDPVKTARLDTMLPRAKTVFVRPESSDNNIVFVPNPAAERKAKKTQTESMNRDKLAALQAKRF